MVTIKSKSEIECMREAGRVADLVQKEIEKAIKPGVTTLDLDKIAEAKMRELGALPAEKGYPSGMKGVPDFPASICSSVNDVVIVSSLQTHSHLDRNADCFLHGEP